MDITADVSRNCEANNSCEAMMPVLSIKHNHRINADTCLHRFARRLRAGYAER
jgi:hypothetical protein